MNVKFFLSGELHFQEPPVGIERHGPPRNDLLITSQLLYLLKSPHKKSRNISVSACKSPQSGSNQRPTDYKSVALPAELWRHFLFQASCSIVTTNRS